MVAIKIESLYRGFNDVTNPSGIYYQSWSNGVATVNTGPTGLENFGSPTFPSIELLH